MSLAQSYDVIVIPRPLAVGLGLRAAAPGPLGLTLDGFVVCAVLAALGVVTALLRGAEGGDPSSVSDARPDDEGPAG